MEAAKAGYSCAQMEQPVVLPSAAMVTLTVFDFISGVSGEHIEQLTVPLYDYFRTPLRPSSDNDITSTVYSNRATKTFTSTEAGEPGESGAPGASS